MRTKTTAQTTASVPTAIWRATFQAANQPILLLDRRLRVIACNRAACAMYHVRRKQNLIGMSLRMLRTAATRRTLGAQIRSVDQTGRGRWETRHIRPDGVEIDVEASVRRIWRKDWRGYVYVARDITAIKQAHEAIRMQVQMLDAIGEAVIATDPAGRIIYSNRFARKLYGWTTADLVGRNIMEVTVDGGDRADAARIMRQLRQGRIWKGEFRVRHRSGRTFPAQISNAPVFDDAGRLVAIIGVSADISERKQAEAKLLQAGLAQRKLAEQLAEEKARLVDAQAVARTGSWETDLKTGAVTWSAETHRIFETDPATFRPTHRKFLRLVHPADRQKVDRAFLASLNRRKAFLIEHRIRLPDGRIKHVEERWRSFFDPRGQPVRAVGTCRDITARKLAEAALLESEARFRSIFEQAGIGIALVDPTDGRILRSNAALAGLLGYSTKGLCRLTVQSVSQEDDYAWDRRQWERMLAGKMSRFQMEKRFIRRDGTEVFGLLTSTLVRDVEGKPLFIIGMVEDISPRKIAEAGLRSSERRLHALVGQLNSVREEEAKRIARELHDDLGQQLTALSLLLASPSSPPPGLMTGEPGWRDQMQRRIDHAVETVQRISGELRLGQLDVLGLPAAIEWQLQEFSRLTAIRCRATRLDEVAGLSDMPKTAFFRILQEALTNIARHADATRVTVQLRAGPKSVILTVRDNGRGISPAEQSDPSSLGLLGMRERAELAGGTFAISGKAGRGTTVQVVLPRPDPV